MEGKECETDNSLARIFEKVLPWESKWGSWHTSKMRVGKIVSRTQWEMSYFSSRSLLERSKRTTLVPDCSSVLFLASNSVARSIVPETELSSDQTIFLLYKFSNYTLHSNIVVQATMKMNGGVVCWQKWSRRARTSQSVQMEERQTAMQKWTRGSRQGRRRRRLKKTKTQWTTMKTNSTRLSATSPPVSFWAFRGQYKLTRISRTIHL